ncbi:MULTISPECIES: phage tail protein [unclassified Aeromonas]|uniref:phage tail protein n=1 Tax=unclassified Aeromonas TaxID=257493 RepID=UPI0022E5055D|nr:MULTISPECIES: phage tail protein [unclassified Aeromonas]
MYWLDNNSGISTMPTTPAVVSLTKKFFSNGGVGEPPSIPEDFWFNMVQEELLGVLTLAGITPDKSDLNQVAKAIQSIAFSAYPVGSPIPWPTTVPPSGFLVMTGQSFNPSTYPKLAMAYPGGVLPDMRAQFIRGLDSGKGIDVGRAILTLQGDAIREISGSLRTVSDASLFEGPGQGATGAFVPSELRKFATLTTSAGSLDNYPRTISFSAAASGVPVAAENRPKNVAFNFIVRAA